MDKEMSEKMNEFLDKVDALCFEYGYEIHPTIHGWTGKTDENGKYQTIAIIGNNEIGEVVFIDGDGRSEQLVCPNCGSFAIETTHNHQHDCFNCGENWWTN
jgi:ribosomal protein S27AE